MGMKAFRLPYLFFYCPDYMHFPEIMVEYTRVFM